MPFNQELRDASGGKKESEDSSATSKSSSDARQIELNFLNSVAADYKRLLRLDEDAEQKSIDIQVTSDGLRVTLFDRARRPLFLSKSTELTPWGNFVMQNLAWLIERHRFQVVIDGHTSSNLKLPGETYSAWELSADRANAARRSLVHYAVDQGCIERVTGYADTRPIDGEPPDSESNQRITLSLSLSKAARGQLPKDTAAVQPAEPKQSQPAMPTVSFTPPAI